MTIVVDDDNETGVNDKNSYDSAAIKKSNGLASYNNLAVPT